MFTLRQVVFACWLIFIIYWFISARSVKSTQETRGWLGGNWYPILLLIGFLFIVNFRFLARFGIPSDSLAFPIVPDTPVINIIAVILLFAGLIIAIIARKTLAENWSAEVALKKDHQLIKTGLYNYVRHPIYAGILLMALGTVLSFGTLSACIGYFIILFTIWLKLKQEEALLAEHFSEEYASYKKRTKILIPLIW